MNPTPRTIIQLGAVEHLSYPVAIVGLLVGGLLLFALVLLVTVARKSQRVNSTVTTVKSGFGALLWVVPAVALIALIGSKSRPAFAPHSPPTPVVVQHDRAIAYPLEAPAAVPSQVVLNAETLQLEPQAQAAPVLAEAPELPASAAESPVKPVEPPARPAVPPGFNADSERVTTNLNDLLATVIPKTAPRLTPRGESSKAPAWSVEEPGAKADPNRPVFRSGRYITPEEATADVTAKAVAHLQYRFQTELNAPIEVTPALIDTLGVDELVLEKFPKTVGLSDGQKVDAWYYIAHLRLKVADELRTAVYADWRKQLVNRRLVTLGGGLGLVTLLLGTLGTYFRLDEATGGRYRTRLRVAAGAVLAAAGMTAMLVA